MDERLVLEARKGVTIGCIADTHGHPFTIPPCDIFIHAGDITRCGSLHETALFAQWLKEQHQTKHIVLVPGNHDEAWEKNLTAVKKLFDDRVNILINASIIVGDVRIFGSAYTPVFMEWFFMADEDALRRRYQSMPKELDVLVTHGPPYGILDPGWKNLHAGSEALLEAILQRQIRHHVFGHLHAAGGQNAFHHETFFHNVAAVDEAYKLVRKAIILEL